MSLEQELFNEALAHIRKQGCPSLSDEGCMYRSPEGHGCAIAPFIIKYDPEMENISALEMTLNFRDCVDSRVFKVDPIFLNALQDAHDSASSTNFMKAYEYRMQRIASDWGLDYEAV